MPMTDAPGKARALYDARRDRVPIEPFTDDDPPSAWPTATPSSGS